MKKVLALIAVLMTALVLVSCGNDDPQPRSDNSAESPSDSREFNEADVSFAQGMIPHHQQAVEMAELAADRSADDQVKQLAADIEAAQAPEIDQLTTWLDQWGAESPSTGMDHGDMGHGDSGNDMSGMMTEEDMTMLEEATGAQFDRAFLEMMIEHHKGAVDMAETEVAEGQNPDAIEMAQNIISTQEAEIEQMQELLDA